MSSRYTSSFLTNSNDQILPRDFNFSSSLRSLLRNKTLITVELFASNVLCFVSSMKSMNSKNAKLETVLMDPVSIQPKAHEIFGFSENFDPNVSNETSLAKSARSTQRNLKSKFIYSVPVISPRNRIRERRFVVVPKNSKQENKDLPSVDCKCGAKTNSNMKKCVCVAYETLRTSQEEFFQNRRESESEIGKSIHNVVKGDEIETDEIEVSSMKSIREKILQEARMSLPEYGKVMHLVKAFEKLNCFPFSKASDKHEGNQTEDKIKKLLKWELPGMSLQQQPKCPETENDQVTRSSSFSPSDLILTSTNLGLEQHPHASVSSSWDITCLNSNGGRWSRRNSLDSSASVRSRRSKKKQTKKPFKLRFESLDSYASMGSRKSKNTQVKVPSLKPFKLITEERGRIKEEEFAKKLQEMTTEEEKMRFPIAQGLPWTTDEPEILVKPHVKDITQPVDLKLHSDIRAVERAEFDYQVAEKINLIKQYKKERERQRKLAEEEEIRRLRKELIPKAQPMPYFDRPFIPKRSNKHPTIPRDPKFNIAQHKRIICCSTSSLSDAGSYKSDSLYQQDL